MRRILIVGLSDVMGGTETFLMNYYRNIDRDKIQFDFLTNKAHIAFEEEIKQMGGKVYRILSPKKGFLKYKKSIKTFFQMHSRDYLAIWMNTSVLINLDYLKYAKKYGIQSRIIHSHTSKNFNGLLFGIVHNLNKRHIINKFATDFWACSMEAGKWFYTEDIMKSKHFSVISNAIDVDQYKYNEEVRQKYRRELGLGDAFVLGNVGRLHPLKNHSFMLDVFKQIQKKCDNSYLVCVGDGELAEEIAEKAKNLGIENKVKMLGSRQDVPDLLQVMDAFMLPSVFEGLPLSLLEAQAAGLVCYASKGVISEEVKVTSELTFLPLDNNPGVWADAILKTMDAIDREKMYKEVKASRFDIKNAAKDLEEKFHKMEMRLNEN